MNNIDGPWIDPTEDQVGRLKTLMAELVNCCQERLLLEAKRFDLPRAELKCLVLFKEERYLTAKSISARLEVGKSRVTKLIQGLIDKGLVERVDDPRDARVKLISLTRAGHDKMERVNDFVGQAYAEVLAQVQPRQRTTLLASLELLRSAMELVRESLR